MGSNPISSEMVSFHSVEVRYRTLYSCVSLIGSSCLIWESVESVLFNLCPISLVYTSFYEGFICFIWLTVLLVMVLHMPLLGYHVLCFLSSGLYDYEYKKCVKWLYLVTCIFSMSVLCCTWVVIPSVVSFFLEFESEFLFATIKIVDFVVLLGVLVECCVFCCVIPFIPRAPRRYLYFGVLVLCGCVTPPDVVSLVVLSMLVIVMLEVSYLCRCVVGL